MRIEKKELSQTVEYCDRLFTLGERLGEANCRVEEILVGKTNQLA